MRARIYQPARNAMQSGMARTHHWVLEFAPASRREIDPLMGWTSSDDTRNQVRMRFTTRAEAESYAHANDIPYDVLPSQERAANIRAGGYGENFTTNRRGSTWTH